MAELARTQRGVATFDQLTALGYSKGAIAHNLETGRLHRIHRGVYAVGHLALSREAMCLAAVLTCGSMAAISHGSAAWMWGLSTGFPDPPHVTTSVRGHRRSGVRLHHSTILEERDRVVCAGIPTTSVARTLLDLAIGQPRKRLEGALELAERRDLLDIGAVDELLARSGRHPGRKRLRLASRLFRAPVMSRARSERLLLDVIRRARLPRPAINYVVAGCEVDAYWEKERFAVEIDGYETHRTRAAFERDPLQIEALKLAGIDAIRITARRLEREPAAVAANLAALLKRRGAETRSPPA